MATPRRPSIDVFVQMLIGALFWLWVPLNIAVFVVSGPRYQPDVEYLIMHGISRPDQLPLVWTYVLITLPGHWCAEMAGPIWDLRKANDAHLG